MAFAYQASVHAAIAASAAQHDSFYLYGEKEIIHAAQQLRTHFPDVTFLYSLKNNPCAEITKTLVAQGFGADAASLGEVMQSVALGIAKENIQYSAPGKTDTDIATALPIATIIADSVGEVARIQTIAAAQGLVADIGLRIHPEFSFDGGTCLPSKFGIEQAQAIAAISAWCAMPNIHIVGLHIHCRSQSLAADLLQRYHQNVLACAQTIQQALGAPLQFINMGAGFGIPYAPDDQALSLSAIAQYTNQAIHTFHTTFPNTRIYIETGRYCVGNNGLYATKVLDKKSCGDKTYLILANTLNGFIRPSLANWIEAASSAPTAAEPLYTSQHAFDIFPLPQHAPQDPAARETVTLVGNLCTATDLLADAISLPPLMRGDMIVITNAGSYAAVLSPMQFSNQIPPAQLFLTTQGEIISAT
ncbi:MAG: diaminopimelate decarboxylase [Faecalibacterium sp.]